MQQRSQQGVNVKLLLSPVGLAKADALIDSVSLYIIDSVFMYLIDNQRSFASNRLQT